LFFACSQKKEQRQGINQSKDSITDRPDSIYYSSTSDINSTDIKKKFSEIKRKYENEFDTVSSTDVRFNDFTGDGMEEALLYYTLTSREGNYFAGSGLVLYNIFGGKPEFILDINLDGAVIKSIKGNMLDCVKYEYESGDAKCCPSKRKPFILEFVNNKFNFIPKSK
jgi:hypothetical protein